MNQKGSKSIGNIDNGIWIAEFLFFSPYTVQYMNHGIRRKQASTMTFHSWRVQHNLNNRFSVAKEWKERERDLDWRGGVPRRLIRRFNSYKYPGSLKSIISLQAMEMWRINECPSHNPTWNMKHSSIISILSVHLLQLLDNILHKILLEVIASSFIQTYLLVDCKCSLNAQLKSLEPQQKVTESWLICMKRVKPALNKKCWNARTNKFPDIIFKTSIVLLYGGICFWNPVQQAWWGTSHEPQGFCFLFALLIQ